MNTPHTETPHAQDWLSTVLWQDARLSEDLAHDKDAAFVSQVMTRLETPSACARPGLTRATPKLLRWLLLGFQVLVVFFLAMAAPAIMQAWWHIAQAPLDGAAWQDPNVWGFVLGLAMLVYGVHELVNLPEEHPA